MYGMRSIVMVRVAQKSLLLTQYEVPVAIQIINTFLLFHVMSRSCENHASAILVYRARSEIIVPEAVGHG